MVELLHALEGILEHLRKMRRPVVSLLQPGIDNASIQARLALMALRPPIALEALYSWRNGTKIGPGDSLDDAHFFPGFYFLSVEDAFSAYTSFHKDHRWDAAWFPIFANGRGDFYALELSRDGNSGGGIVGFILGESDHPVEYLSLSHMMATLLECFRSKAFFEKNGYLEMDDAKHAKIARKMNPGLSDWENA